MSVPHRFAVEYPGRVTDLIDLFEATARDKNLLGSFGLLVAAAVLTIPYERMQKRHFLHDQVEDKVLAAAFKSLERGRFRAAEFWDGSDPGDWREYRIAAETVERASDWRDYHSGLNPFQPGSHNKVDEHTPEHVIRIIRNALSHGNIIYLNAMGLEEEGSAMEYLAFLTPYPSGEGEPLTYRVLITREEELLQFVRQWAMWIARFSQDDTVAE